MYIQQDKAKPHIDPNDEAWLAAVTASGINIQLKFQPPNSPDMNVLDLGHFRAIQWLQYKRAARDIDELFAAVHEYFAESSRKKLNNIFLSLQQCLIETMKVDGPKKYKLPHMEKDSLDHQDSLPLRLECPIEVYERARALVDEGIDIWVWWFDNFYSKTKLNSKKKLPIIFGQYFHKPVFRDGNLLGVSRTSRTYSKLS